MNLGLPIHHIGVATHKISDELFYYKALGFIYEDEFVDETQGVRGIFLVSSNFQMPQYRLELLENLEANGPLDNYLQNHTKMYHIAYETQSIEKSVENLFASLDYQHKLNLELDKNKYGICGGGERKAMIIQSAKKASYFSRVCFVMLRNHLLVEFVEK